MLIRKRIGALLLSCAIAVSALLALTLPASASTAQPAAAAACGWEAIYTASSSSGNVQLQYDTCDRYVRAYGYDLVDPYGCHINLGCHGSAVKVWVYNEDTGAAPGSGALINTSTYTSAATDDANTYSHACLQSGSDDNGTITWGAKTCTGYF